MQWVAWSGRRWVCTPAVGRPLHRAVPTNQTDWPDQLENDDPLENRKSGLGTLVKIRLFLLLRCRNWISRLQANFVLASGTVRRHRQSWRRGVVASWRRGVVASWRRGVVASWRRGVVASWRRGVVASWRRGVVASWRRGVVASWRRGVVASWRRGVVASWRRGVVASWRRGVVASWRRGVVASWRYAIMTAGTDTDLRFRVSAATGSRCA